MNFAKQLTQIGEVHIIPFDTKVLEEQVFVLNNQTMSKLKLSTCGGTDFDAITEYANKRDFDVLYVATDGPAPKPINSKILRMWVIPESAFSEYPLVQKILQEPIVLI